MQYQALLATEGVELEFTDDSIQRIAEIAWSQNETEENIGARRLHTVLERLLEELSYEAPDIADKHVIIDRAYVDDVFGPQIVDEQAYTKYLI